MASKAAERAERKKCRVSPLLRRLLEAGGAVSADALRQYSPTRLDAEICATMMEGITAPVALAKALKVPYDQLRKYLTNPVRAAYIGTSLGNFVKDRLNMVAAAMFAQAMGGDVAAARLLFDRFGAVGNVAHVIHHKGADLSRMTDDELDIVLQDKLRKDKVIDVSFDVKS
jgi:hypothetical protein